MIELCKLIREMKCVLYGNGESEPLPEACAQLTEEFFKENTMRLLVLCLPKLNLEVNMNLFYREECYTVFQLDDIIELTIEFKFGMFLLCLYAWIFYDSLGLRVLSLLNVYPFCIEHVSQLNYICIFQNGNYIQ